MRYFLLLFALAAVTSTTLAQSKVEQMDLQVAGATPHPSQTIKDSTANVIDRLTYLRSLHQQRETLISRLNFIDGQIDIVNALADTTIRFRK